MIFIHGWPGIGLTWRAQMDAFAAEGWRCIAPDMRGYGRSSVPDAKDAYTIEKAVTDMADLHDHLGGQPATWVGHDWGSIVVGALAAHQPERAAARHFQDRDRSIRVPDRGSAGRDPRPPPFGSRLAQHWGLSVASPGLWRRGRHGHGPPCVTRERPGALRPPARRRAAGRRQGNSTPRAVSREERTSCRGWSARDTGRPLRPSRVKACSCSGRGETQPHDARTPRRGRVPRASRRPVLTTSDPRPMNQTQTPQATIVTCSPLVIGDAFTDAVGDIHELAAVSLTVTGEDGTTRRVQLIRRGGDWWAPPHDL
jgi:pimeloyl-ACP methyl ester carboxylesterase